VHAHAILGQAQEPFHCCAREMGAAGRGHRFVRLRRPDDRAGAIDEVAVKAGVVIGIFYRAPAGVLW